MSRSRRSAKPPWAREGTPPSAAAPDAPERTGVIGSVSSAPVGRSRLTLQSICRSDGIRALRPVWEYEAEPGQWRLASGPPEFQPRYWVDVISKAAAAGLLGSQAYKDLVVNLAKGLDSSKTPSPKAFLRVTGHMNITFGPELLERDGVRINEIRIYHALERDSREVSATHSSAEGQHGLRYRVVEEMHYDQVISRLGDLGPATLKDSLSSVFSEQPRECFELVFGDPGLLVAGFEDPATYQAEFEVTVI